MAIADLLKPAVEMEDAESPEARRRLSEKVLSAFNYAYAIGERDIARRLHEALAVVEALNAGSPSQQRAGGALKQAELWVAYIEARNSYHSTARNGRDASKALAALEAMKDAYKRWSFS
jgi:hypothetical protein